MHIAHAVSIQQWASRLVLVLAISTLAACGGAAGDGDGSTAGGDGGGSGGGDGGDGSVTSESVLVEWSAPTERVDGSPLSVSAIGGFVVYKGEAADDLTSEARIEDRTVTSHLVEGLGSGTHYFSVSTFDVDGREGPDSEPVSVTIP